MGRGWTGIPYKFCGLQRCFAMIQLVFLADVTENLVILAPNFYLPDSERRMSQGDAGDLGKEWASFTRAIVCTN